MINEQMVTRNGQKGFLDDKGNFYPIADIPADDAKVTPSSSADQSGGLGSPDVQPRTSANANRDGSRPGGGMTDAQIKAAQVKQTLNVPLNSREVHIRRILVLSLMVLKVVNTIKLQLLPLPLPLLPLLNLIPT